MIHWFGVTLPGHHADREVYAHRVGGLGGQDNRLRCREAPALVSGHAPGLKRVLKLTPRHVDGPSAA